MNPLPGTGPVPSHLSGASCGPLLSRAISFSLLVDASPPAPSILHHYRVKKHLPWPPHPLLVASPVSAAPCPHFLRLWLPSPHARNPILWRSLKSSMCQIQGLFFVLVDLTSQHCRLLLHVGGLLRAAAVPWGSSFPASPAPALIPC